MYHTLAAGTLLNRVTGVGRTPTDVLSGSGSYYSPGGRYNRVHQRTVYTSEDPFVSIAEVAFHVASDLQSRVGGEPVQSRQPLPTPPFVSQLDLWCFQLNAPATLLDVEHPGAVNTFQHRVYELWNPARGSYYNTVVLADAIRLHPHPNPPPTNPAQAVDGILAPSVRTPAVGHYSPRQQILFVPQNAITISATVLNRWRLTLEFADQHGHSVTPQSGVIDWGNPWFRLSGSGRQIPPYQPRPRASALRPRTWDQTPIKYT